MQVIPINLFEDNYCYAIYSHSSTSYALIDPADFQSTINFTTTHADLSTRSLAMVFFTHKHSDHARDSLIFSRTFPEIQIIAGEIEEIPGCNKPVKDNEVIEEEGATRVKCIHAPCHTRGHMLYYFSCGAHSVLFTGDTLFIGGCGKFFEGNAQEMWRNFERIREIPGDCLVYCGHEYTVANLEWASRVEVDNQAMKRKLVWARERRGNGLVTVPSTIAEELEINIFIRAALMIQKIGASHEIEALGMLREWKNKGKTLE